MRNALALSAYHQRQAAALPVEQCALVDLVQFLRAGSGDSPLKTLQRLCNEAIKAAALALTQ